MSYKKIEDINYLYENIDQSIPKEVEDCVSLIVETLSSSGYSQRAIECFIETSDEVTISNLLNEKVKLSGDVVKQGPRVIQALKSFFKNRKLGNAVNKTTEVIKNNPVKSAAAVTTSSLVGSAALSDKDEKDDEKDKSGSTFRAPGIDKAEKVRTSGNEVTNFVAGNKEKVDDAGNQSEFAARKSKTNNTSIHTKTDEKDEKKDKTEYGGIGTKTVYNKDGTKTVTKGHSSELGIDSFGGQKASSEAGKNLLDDTPGSTTSGTKEQQAHHQQKVIDQFKKEQEAKRQKEASDDEKGVGEWGKNEDGTNREQPKASTQIATYQKGRPSPATFKTNQRQTRELVKNQSKEVYPSITNKDLNQFSRSKTYTADDGKTQVKRSTVFTKHYETGKPLGVMTGSQRKAYDIAAAKFKANQNNPSVDSSKSTAVSDKTTSFADNKNKATFQRRDAKLLDKGLKPPRYEKDSPTYTTKLGAFLNNKKKGDLKKSNNNTITKIDHNFEEYDAKGEVFDENRMASHTAGMSDAQKDAATSSVSRSTADKMGRRSDEAAFKGRKKKTSARYSSTGGKKRKNTTGRGQPEQYRKSADDDKNEARFPYGRSNIVQGKGSIKDLKKEDFDAFDIVLGYLSESGQVDSMDEALYIMMEMDAATIQGIVKDFENLYEEAADKEKDDRLVKYGIGHDGSDRNAGSGGRSDSKKPKGKTNLQKETEKKHGKGKSPLEVAKAEIEAKYGKGAIAPKKKKS